MPFPWVMGLGIPHRQGKTQSGNCAPQTRFRSLVPTPDHPTHPTAMPSGPYLSARCGSGGYGRSRGCATRLGHFMGWQEPVGSRARGSGHPIGHLPALGTHGWVTRWGSPVGHWDHPLHFMLPSAFTLFTLIIFYCHRELTRLSIPIPLWDLPAARGQPQSGAICPHLFLERPRSPGMALPAPGVGFALP